jgi:glycosyltransferase involved in cell wall biosynthesis
MSSKRPLRVLIGITKSNFGGAQRYVYDLALELKHKKHLIKVLTGTGGTLQEKLEASEIPFISLETLSRNIALFSDIKAFASMLDILYIERPDIFHVNSSKMGILGSLAGRIMGIRKIVFTAHGWAFNEPRPAYERLIIKFLAWLTVLLSHKTICVSEKTRQDIASLPFIKHKLVVIYNGLVSFETLSQPKARQELGLPLGAFIVGTIAELHPIKGLDVLLEAWEIFTRSHTGHLTIIGDGEEKQALEQEILKRKLSGSVTLTGFINNARELLPAFDVFILPSRSEGLPYGVLEAGSAGLPVVASHVGGIPEIIENNVSGLLIPPLHPDALSGALILLKDNPVLRNELATNIKERIDKHFSLGKMTRDTLKIYG